MKIPEFEIRALKFIKNDFMPVLPSSLYRFLGWVGVAAFSGRVEQAIVEHQGLLRIAGVINGDEALKMLGIADDDDMISYLIDCIGVDENEKNN